MLIDVHAHLGDKAFDLDRETVIKSSFCDGVKVIIDTGADVSSSLDALNRAKTHDGIYCAVGVHPEYADQLTDTDLDVLKTAYEHEKTVAIGEIGLDYHYDDNPSKDEQKRAFLAQLALADELNAPVVIHVREAHGDALNLLKQNAKFLRNGLLIHCYSGSKELVKEYAKIGAYFSFGGAVTFHNAKDKPDVVRAVPIDRLLIETDCPYMTPTPHRGKRNQPSYANLTAQKIAEFLDMDVEKLKEITSNNALRLFTKIKL